ncbi:hypothetical protein, partial [Paraburkholderia sp. SIMBA_053]|uniref:hypothetical protein n=1 Tax=Paraburkholderia sp. SIMBA_053 TaxID=3085794 RepID=UPI00397CDE5F
ALIDEQSALGFSARAASAQASGDDTAARSDLERAAALATEFPTYYGAAWVMLSTAMLTDDALGGCGTGAA